MTATKTIEIGVDVYKTIESNRLTFSEQHNDILRRLLGLNIINPTSCKRKGWLNQGVFLLDKTELMMMYNGTEYQAHIEGHRISCEGKLFKSLSGAARHATSVIEINGWVYWVAEVETDYWVTLDSLRSVNSYCPVI